MNTAEIKLDLFRRIDSLSGDDLKRNYNKILKLLNNQSEYKLTLKERKAIEEAMEESKKGDILTHEQVLAEAKQKYSNLKFE
jgi:UDP-N-acetylmuramyl tripeptide synthase